MKLYRRYLRILYGQIMQPYFGMTCTWVYASEVIASKAFSLLTWDKKNFGVRCLEFRALWHDKLFTYATHVRWPDLHALLPLGHLIICTYLCMLYDIVIIVVVVLLFVSNIFGHLAIHAVWCHPLYAGWYCVVYRIFFSLQQSFQV